MQPQAVAPSQLRGRKSVELGGLLFLLAVGGLLGFGGWVSLHYVFGLIYTDSDIAYTVMMWSGIHEHGLSFLTSWIYTPDNFLFTLIPLASLAYELFGPEPVVVIGLGWAIYLGAVLLATASAWHLTRRRTALLLAPLLLFASEKALGYGGFLAYPVTHNVSMLFGLAGLLCAVLWLIEERWRWLLAGGCLLLAGAASDPWVTAAFELPLAAASLSLAILSRTGSRQRGLTLRLAGVGLVAILLGEALARTHFFGVFPCFPAFTPARPEPALLLANLLWLGHLVPTLVSLFPGLEQTSFVPSLLTWGVIAWIGWGMARTSVGRFRHLGTPMQFVVLFAALSCGFIAGGFLIVAVPGDPEAGRYLMNAYILVPLVVVSLLLAQGAYISRSVKKLSVVAAVLMTAAGLLSDPAAWLHGTLSPSQLRLREAGEFLQSHGLTYGYGPYWSVQANAMSWLSGGRVRIRPVTFDPVTGHIARRMSETSSLWYQPGDAHGAPRTFIAVAGGVDGCRDIARCLHGVTEQFGKPAEAYRFEDLMTVLVYERPLVP